MSFRWTRQGDFTISVCGLCGHVTRERTQTAILRQQRDHDPLTCQRWRIESARAARGSGVSSMIATELEGRPWDNGDISETATSVTSTPPLAPRHERSTSMKSSASRPVPPLDSRGVA